jgi:hypothetical protein
MRSQTEKAMAFRALHERPSSLSDLADHMTHRVGWRN